MLDDSSRLAIPTANPRAKIWDMLPPRFRVWWKQSYLSTFFFANHHDEIIPATDKHGAWVLGAQPGDYTIRLLKTEYPAATNLQIISMLSDCEKVAHGDPTSMGWSSSSVAEKKWYDHGCLNQDTGQIETVASMVSFQQPLFQTFEMPNTVCYCHCMAGVARSLTETAVFLYSYIYLNPSDDRSVDERARILFDFDHRNWVSIWEKVIKKKEEAYIRNLQNRLQNKPTLLDLIEYIRLQRPTAKDLTTAEGDQAKLMRLIAEIE